MACKSLSNFRALAQISWWLSLHNTLTYWENCTSSLASKVLWTAELVRCCSPGPRFVGCAFQEPSQSMYSATSTKLCRIVTPYFERHGKNLGLPKFEHSSDQGLSSFERLKYPRSRKCPSSKTQTTLSGRFDLCDQECICL